MTEETEQTRNVFENQSEEIFPVTIYKNGQRIDIGTGRVVRTDEVGVHIEFEHKGAIHTALLPLPKVPTTTYHRPGSNKPETNFGFPPPPRPIHEE